MAGRAKAGPLALTVAALMAFGAAPPPHAQVRPAETEAPPMAFANHCEGNNVVACVITATGRIDPQAAERFRAYLREESPEASRVLLSSTGGSLLAGMDLGRAIRGAGFATEIGTFWPDPDGWNGTVVRNGLCLSACAYAFLGGQTRRVHAEGQLGFHQFFVNPASLRGAASDSAITAAMREAQSISGEILAYLLEMGIDARLFVLSSGAAPSEIAFPDAQTRLDYGLETPTGFSAFFLEPFRNGVVAASRRTSPTGLYDLLTQVTAFCRDDEAMLLLTVGGPTEHLFDAILRIDDGSEIRIPAAWQRRRSESVELPLTPAQASAVSGAQELEVGVGRAMAFGGGIGAEFRLTEMDRAMLRAAFRFCI